MGSERTNLGRAAPLTPYQIVSIAAAKQNPYCDNKPFSRTHAQAYANRLADMSSEPPQPSTAWPVDHEVSIQLSATVSLNGRLTIPERPVGIVLFAHGSGSSMHSPRNRFVADILHSRRVATLMFDLLTEHEAANRANVFDIELLAGRLISETSWVCHQPETAGLPIGYFGASTGAGAALWAAAEEGAEIKAVVSRGGRPDLAGDRLLKVGAPTLLIVGGADTHVIALNRKAAVALHCPVEVAIVPGATHLFEEPGTLRAAAELAGDWFQTHLVDHA